MTLLPVEFYARDALDVARDVLGAVLVHGRVAVRITDVEAYRWPGDTACHGRHGRTERNRSLWGPPGRAYVYLCYGLHHLLNFVTGQEGEAAAVLIRGAEPVEGLSLLRRRRGGVPDRDLLSGPGKVTQALGIDLRHDGRTLYEPGGLELHEGDPVKAYETGPRIGIDYAAPDDRAAPWRYYVHRQHAQVVG